MMIAFSLLVVLLSIGCMSAHRTVDSKLSNSIAKEDVHGTVDGINDWHKAAEYSDSWADPELLEAAKDALMKKIADMEKNAEDFTDEQRKEMMQTIWLIANQELLEAASMGCTKLCAMCVPSPKQFEKGGDVELKTLFIDRSKGWADVMKMPIVAPIDAVGGIAGGILGGLVLGVGAGAVGGTVAGVATGAYVNKKTNATAPGIILGSLAGISTGAVTGAAVLVLSELFLPAMGAFKGAGLTKKVTECSRVGFRASVNGKKKEGESFQNKRMNKEYGLKALRKKMGYDKTWFTKAPAREQAAIIARDSESALKSLDYTAISHCEYLRLSGFDVRHVLECIKHSLLCGSHGAILLPANSKSTCEAMSSSAKLEEDARNAGVEDGLADMWKDAKDRAKCVKMLCDYKGFKKASLKTHPDRLQGLNDEEKKRLSSEFVFLNSCKDRFKTAQGEPLTLNKKEEQKEMCNPQE